MINVSDEFLNTMHERTDFQQYAVIRFADGSSMTLDQTKFTLQNNNVVDGAGANSFPLGVAIERTMQIELANSEEEYKDYHFYGATIHPQVRFALPSGRVESIDYGKFTVMQPENYGATIIITAVDDMRLADAVFHTNLTTPVTAGTLLQDICSNIGLPLASSNFRNSNMQILELPTNEVTYRTMIGYIAMIAVGNARVNRSGRLEILEYDFSAINDYTPEDIFLITETGAPIITDQGYGILLKNKTKIHTLYEWLSPPNFYTDTVVISGVELRKEQQETVQQGTADYMISVENPLVSGWEDTFVSLLGDVLIGGKFLPFSGDHIAYPIAEFMDPVIVEDRNGNRHFSIITDIDFHFAGVTTLKNTGEAPLRNNQRTMSNPTKMVSRLEAILNRVKKQLETEYENLADIVANASGFYVTDEKQEDGSIIHYSHNKPTLEESNVIWKETSETRTVSTDGGETWNGGMTADGDTIVRILNAVGINASWIRSGELTIKDTQGNVVLYANANTGEVRLDGARVVLGQNKTVDTALTDLLDRAKTYSDGQLADYARTVTADMDDIWAQLDNQIEQYYGDYTPSTSNAPAQDWNTDALKESHLGDMFYSSSTGYAYRWIYNNGAWGWQIIQDTGVTQALAMAQTAKDTADGKRRVFLAQPTPPYDMGDVWMEGTSGDIKVCTYNSGRAAGTVFVSTDWEKLNKYTDDTRANEAYELAKANRALVATLDNDYQAIPTDYEGNYSTFPECRTQITVYFGKDNITGSCQYSVAKSQSVTGSWDANTKTYTVTGLSEDTGWVDIAVLYLNAFTVTKRFVLSKIRAPKPPEDAYVYELEASQSAIVLDNDGTMKPESITYSAFSRVGSGTREAYEGTFVISESADGVNWNEVYRSSDPESSITHMLYQYLVTDAGTPIITDTGILIITGAKDIMALRCTLLSADGDVLDTQTCPIIKAGGALVASLTNETVSMTADINGVVPSYEDCWTEITVFHGDINVTNACTYAVTVSDGLTGEWDPEGHRFAVTDLTENDGWADIVATYEATSVTRRFTISKSLKGDQGIQGLQGLQGDQGVQGVKGDKGDTGDTTYFHIKYSAVANPTQSSQMTETPSTYIGTYVDFKQADSTKPSDYTWARFQGMQGVQGEQGIPGVNGANGTTYYLHIKYSNDGGKKFTQHEGYSTGEYPGDWIGQCVNTDETDPAYVSAYTWSKIKGEQGEQGDQGEPGRTYFLELSTPILKKGQDTAISPATVSVYAYQRAGDAARQSYSGRFRIETSSDGTNWITRYTSSSDVTSFSFSVVSGTTTGMSGTKLTISSTIIMIRVTLFMAGGTASVLDQQSIMVLTDVSNLTHEDIFNLLTNNGAMKGIYQEGNNLYISFTYAKGGTLTLGGSNNGNGILKMLNSNGAEIGRWDNSGISLNNGKVRFDASGNATVMSLTAYGSLICYENYTIS